MYRQVLTTNVVGPFLLSVALLPSLRKRDTRTIVQVGATCRSSMLSRFLHCSIPTVSCTRVRVAARAGQV